MTEIADLAKSNLLSLRRCFTSLPLMGLLLIMGGAVLLLRQTMPPILATLCCLISQVAAFLGATIYLGIEERLRLRTKSQGRVLKHLPRAISLAMSAVLLHLLLVASVVWPSVAMIPFVACSSAGAALFFIIGIMPAAMLVSGASYSVQQLLIGALLGLPILLLVAGVDAFIQASAWVTPLFRAVFDVAIGAGLGASYFAAESTLRNVAS